MNKFEIGDLVKIGEVRDSNESVPEMHKFKNRVGRIAERHPEQKYRQLVKIEGIEGIDEWWFDENILTSFNDNRRFIDAFLEGKNIEYLSSDGRWLPVFAITRQLLDQQMRLAKSDEVKAIEKEIEYINADIEALVKQKKEIDLQIKNEKARISRREKKIKALS